MKKFILGTLRLLIFICFILALGSFINYLDWPWRVAIGVGAIGLLLLIPNRIKAPVKIVNQSGHDLPAYATAGSAGMDLRANLGSTEWILSPGDRLMIPTGLFISLPKGYEAQIRPRSGLAWKHGVTVLNSPATIDCDYTGEIKVVLMNHSPEDFIIRNGDRIAQMVVAEYGTVLWEPVDSLDKTSRSGGFGSTGTK